MTISQEQAACSVIDGNADHGGLHFPSMADALRYLAEHDDHEGPVPEVRQLDTPCWTARCNVCGTGVGEDDDGLIHFSSGAEAKRAAEADEWTVDGYRNVRCPEDPGDEPRWPVTDKMKEVG